MTITAGASTNSIFVDSSGRVGFKTSTPVLDLHVNTSNTPALRLEQTNSGGFTAQPWDDAGNEANFYVRDVTLGEDHCRVRTGSAPIILATLRNIAINLLNGNAVKNKAAALRRHAAHPHEALALIRGPGGELKDPGFPPGQPPA